MPAQQYALCDQPLPTLNEEKGIGCLGRPWTSSHLCRRLPHVEPAAAWASAPLPSGAALVSFSPCLHTALSSSGPAGPLSAHFAVTYPADIRLMPGLGPDRTPDLVR